MEISVHECSKRFSADLSSVLSLETISQVSLEPSTTDESPAAGREDVPLKAVVTLQRSKYDLVRFDEEIDREKDRLLEQFMEFSKGLAAHITSAGFWVDYIDPCSGLAMIHQDHCGVYNEVQGVQTMLGFSVQNAGCCKILLHPSWGSAVYPATLFTTAPLEIIQQYLGSQEASMCQSSSEGAVAAN